jgi:L-2-amino-thiazoline-4-carboxylic acid hydrolase
MILWMLKRCLFWPARKVLGDRYPPAEVRQILFEAMQRYRERRGDLPAEAGMGGRWMVRCAALTAELFRTLLAHGLTRKEAIERTSALTWLLYEKMALVPGFVSKVLGRGAVDRVKRATGAFRRFPFGPPAYVMVDVPAGEGVVAFDVQRCPVAELFKAQGLSDLCISSFCNLDFPLALKWGATLERRDTLAGGADRCDFRWRVAG